MAKQLSSTMTPIASPPSPTGNPPANHNTPVINQPEDTSVLHTVFYHDLPSGRPGKLNTTFTDALKSSVKPTK